MIMLRRITSTARANARRPPFRVPLPVQPLFTQIQIRPSSSGPKYQFADERANLGGPSQIFKLSQALQQDYDQLAIFYQGMTAAPNASERKGFQNAFVWELARHIVAKELVVLPAIEDTVADGKHIIEQQRAAQKELKQLLSDFQSMNPVNDQFGAKLEAIYHKYCDYTKSLEQETIQKFEQAASLTESKEVCESYERTKMLAPTRSHPNAPAGPGGFETAGAMLLAPLDKLRDLFRTFPKEMDEQGGSSLRSGPKGAPYELDKKEPEHRSLKDKQ